MSPSVSPTDPPVPDCEYVLEEGDGDDDQNGSTTLLLSPVPRPLDDASQQQFHHSARLPMDDADDLTLPSHNQDQTLTTPFLARDSTHASLRSAASNRSGGLQRRTSARYVPELNGLNYLNVVTYGVHLFVSWGIGVWGLDGVLNTRWEISMRYLTLLMPARWAYYLWAPILLLEAAFVVTQLLPDYRSRPLVQAGTGYYFFYVTLLQTAWTLFFSFKLFVCSFVSVVWALLALLALLRSQSLHISSRKSPTEYILLRLPFYLHTGWMILFAVDHFSLLFRYYHASIGLQVAVDIFGLGILLAVAVAYLARPSKADWVIPAVILWSYLGIAWRLHHVDHTMIALYGNEAVSAVRYSVYFFTGAVAVCLIPNVVVWLAHEFLTIQLGELGDA